MKKQKIAVLGAGPMGLAVAYQLIKNNCTPIIFEADDRVGGMAASFDFSGIEIERYYHFHCTSDDALLEMLKDLGLEDQMHWRATKMGYYYNGKTYPWGNPIALLKFPKLSLIAKIRYGLHAFISTKRNDWSKLDEIDAVSWIKKWIGKPAYDVLWKNLFEYKFYQYSNNLSAAWIWSRIRRIGRSRYNIFHEKLGYLENGSETILKALKNYIEENGGEFHLKTPINKVIIKNQAVTGVICSNKTISFDKVVSTIPLPYLPDIMPDLPKKILEQFQNIQNIAVVCVIVKLKKAVTENFWLNINDPQMDIPGLVEYSNLRPLKHHIVYVPFYMPAEHPKFQDSNQVFLDKVKNYLKTINPTLKDSDFIDIKANRYRYAQPICQPSYLNNIPSFNLPVKGLWAADTSYYYPEDRGISESIKYGKMMANEASQ